MSKPQQALRYVKIILITLAVFLVAILTIFYIYARIHLREDIEMACGSRNPYTSEVILPRNSFNKFLYDLPVTKPICDWIKNRYGNKLQPIG